MEVRKNQNPEGFSISLNPKIPRETSKHDGARRQTHQENEELATIANIKKIQILPQATKKRIPIGLGRRGTPERGLFEGKGKIFFFLINLFCLLRSSSGAILCSLRSGRAFRD